MELKNPRDCAPCPLDANRSPIKLYQAIKRRSGTIASLAAGPRAKEIFGHVLESISEYIYIYTCTAYRSSLFSSCRVAAQWRVQAISGGMDNTKQTIEKRDNDIIITISNPLGSSLAAAPHAIRIVSK